MIDLALAGVAQWTECQPVNQRIAGSIPGQDTCLGCGPGPRMGVCKREPFNESLTHLCFSPSLSPSLPLSPTVKKRKKERKELTIAHKIRIVSKSTWNEKQPLQKAIW